MNFPELFRYVIVGAVSFLFDFGILMFFYNVMGLYIPYGLYIATVLGFVGGLALNTYLSVKFVFIDNSQAKNNSFKWHDGASVFLIGIIGLLLTEIGMFVGVEILNIYYVLTKIIVTAIVFLWNYWARRRFVFYRSVLIK